MKLYGLYTPSHESLANEWFLPSLKDKYDLHLVRQSQTGPPEDHRYGTGAFNRTTLEKIDLILQAIDENRNAVFLFSDVDLQFFRPAQAALLTQIHQSDIAFQQNQVNGEINSGFFVCRGNPRTRLLWLGVKKSMQARPDWNDQDALNHVMFRSLPAAIRRWLLNEVTQTRLCRFARWGLAMHRIAYALPLFRNEFGVKWRYLPIEFFTTGLKRGTDWIPGQDLKIPNGIVMHHANFCIGVDAKTRQLDEVQRAVSGQRET